MEGWLQPPLFPLFEFENNLEVVGRTQEKELMSSNDGVPDVVPSSPSGIVDHYLASLLLGHGYSLIGINLKYQVVSWLAVVKVSDIERKRHVAYVGGRTLPIVFKKIKELAFSDGFVWRLDRYQD